MITYGDLFGFGERISLLIERKKEVSSEDLPARTTTTEIELDRLTLGPKSFEWRDETPLVAGQKPEYVARIKCTALDESEVFTPTIQVQPKLHHISTNVSQSTPTQIFWRSLAPHPSGRISITSSVTRVSRADAAPAEAAPLGVPKPVAVAVSVASAPYAVGDAVARALPGLVPLRRSPPAQATGNSVFVVPRRGIGCTLSVRPACCERQVCPISGRCAN